MVLPCTPPQTLRGRGGGLAFLVREDTPYKPLNTDHFFTDDDTTEHQGIVVTIDQIDISIVNLYIPPATSCPSGFVPVLAPLFGWDFGGDALVVGDFNAHHHAWHSPSSDDRALARGELVVSAADGGTLCLLNTEFPTRLPSSGSPSSPDLSFCSAHLFLSALWQPATSLNSDHLPILIDLYQTESSSPDLPPSLYNNYKKADWDGFGDFVEHKLAFMPEPGSCSQGERILRAILAEASSLHIPRGRTRDFVPGLSREARDLITQRDPISNTDPTDPEVGVLNGRIARN